MEISKQSLGKLETEIKEVLSPLEEKYEVKFDFGSGKYTDTSATLQLKVATLSKDGTARTLEWEEFKIWAKTYGFELEDFGKEFMSNGVKYRISGLKRRRRKFPIAATRVSDGVGFKFPAGRVLQALKKES